MDYSLLVGVYYEVDENKESDAKARLEFSNNNPDDLRYVYFNYYRSFSREIWDG
jgi:hypothetical protein